MHYNLGLDISKINIFNVYYANKLYYNIYMNLDWYRVFFQLAKSGSFSKASKDLFVTQPAVSRTIAQLEDSLGCELFYRSRNGVTLTEQGKVLYENLVNAFDSISAAEKAISEIQTLQRGEIKFGASDTMFKYYLVHILKYFKEEYPDIKIRIVSENTSNIVNLIKSGELDFGIINLPADSDRKLEYEPLYIEQDCFVVGGKYKHLTGKRIHLEKLNEYPVMLLNDTTNTRKQINKYFKNNFVTIVPEFESGNTDLLVDFAKNDFGIACVCRNFVKRELESGELFEINLFEQMEPRQINAAWLRSVPRSILAKAFIEKLVERNYSKNKSKISGGPLNI